MRQFIPNDYSGLIDWKIVSHVFPKNVVNFSGVVEAYCGSSLDLGISPVMKSNNLYLGPDAIFGRSDNYPMHNWDKSNFNNFNTEDKSFIPMSVTNASAFSEINNRIVENTLLISVTGVSSCIDMLFSRRPGSISQIIYKIPSLNTSAFTLAKGGGDTGQALNANMRSWQFSSTLKDASTAITSVYMGNAIGIGEGTSAYHRDNQTRGGASYLVPGKQYWVNEFVNPDQAFPASVTTYWDYASGIALGTNITSAVLKSCVIPLDFTTGTNNEGGSQDITYKGVEDGDNMGHYTLWHSMRMYESVTVNHQGIEGSVHIETWFYKPRIRENIGYGTHRAVHSFGPIIPNYFNKAYAYTPGYQNCQTANGQPINLDDTLSFSGGLDYATMLDHHPSWTEADIPWAPSLSAAPQFGFYLKGIHTRIVESNDSPVVAFWPPGGPTNIYSLFQEGVPALSRGSFWATLIWKSKPNFTFESGTYVNSQRLESTDLLVSPRTYFRPLDSNYDIADNGSPVTNPNPWGDKGTLFFDWHNFKLALAYRDLGFTALAKTIADNCCTYCMILEKTAGNFATTTPEPENKPYIASGPMAVAILAKGDTNLDHYNSNNTTGVIYGGNQLSGDFNSFGFTRSNYKNVSLSAHFWPASSTGGPGTWYGAMANLFNVENYSLRGGAAGWTGSQYWMVYGRDVADVKSKVDRIVASGYLNKRPTIDNIPKIVLENVPPITKLKPLNSQGTPT